MPEAERARKIERVIGFSSHEELFELFCSDTKNLYSVFEKVPQKLRVDPNECEFTFIGKPYLQALSGSAVPKGYRYKKTFNKA